MRSVSLHHATRFIWNQVLIAKFHLVDSAVLPIMKVKFIVYLISQGLFSGEKYLSSPVEKVPCKILNRIKTYKGKALWVGDHRNAQILLL